MNRNDEYLALIRAVIEKVETFTSGVDKPAFEADSKTQSAVILQLILMGELAKKLSENSRSSIALPWKEIIGFRDRAIHNYFEIDLDIVCETVLTDLPVMKQALNA